MFLHVQGAIKGAVSIDASEKAKEKTESQKRAKNRHPTGWLTCTVAAVGLGVALAGALTFKENFCC